MTGKLRVFINGFGRIGRTLLRQILEDDARADVEIVGINDIAPLETCIYLLRYDSVYGPLCVPVTTGANQVTIGAKTIPFTRARFAGIGPARRRRGAGVYRQGSGATVCESWH
ncbi:MULTISPECIES: glyceraldehyde 3-phosphate dehydrogenase NAD-binding domain-containing protein [Sulfitobacter]|uniref:glyceraldehyde 3-phosphate dehydrogenase NAD-binding domain-containing protein n=1 Tax=Sulfitobacter TaxID=60136 RepID=UPI000AF7E1CE